MAKLTKAEAKAHAEAVAILTQDALNDDEREFVLHNWHEAADNLNTTAGAHFTPPQLAYDFAIDAHGSGRVLDLCAGIGMLARAVAWRHSYQADITEIVCIERNPQYVAIGQKIIPEARWICADVFDLPDLDLGRFDSVISNPPFGRSAARTRKGPRYTGAEFEYHLIDLVSDHADYGAFILPQNSAPFVYSGAHFMRFLDAGKAIDFQNKLGFEMQPGCGVDTSYHRNEWKTVSPMCEVVCMDFTERMAPAPELGETLDLFAA